MAHLKPCKEKFWSKFFLLIVVLITLHCSSAQEARMLTATQALNQLRPAGTLTVPQIQSVVRNALPGISYPVLSRIPQTSFSCDDVSGTGFYADPETDCQVFRQCHPDGRMFSYLCPNRTIFNQVALVCDWWYNVDCAKSMSFWEYSNPRIYDQNILLLDDGSQIGPVRTTPRPFISVRINTGPAGYGSSAILHNDQSDFYGIMNSSNNSMSNDEITTTKGPIATSTPDDSLQSLDSIIYFTNVTARRSASAEVTQKRELLIPVSTKKPGITRLLYGNMKGPSRDTARQQSRSSIPVQEFVSSAQFFTPNPDQIHLKFNDHQTLFPQQPIQRATSFEYRGQIGTPSTSATQSVTESSLTREVTSVSSETNGAPEIDSFNRVVVRPFGSRPGQRNRFFNHSRGNLDAFVQSLWVA